MVTSTGEIRVQPIAWAKNRLARIGVPARREVHVDDLAELVHGSEQVAPGPSDLEVGLIDVPAIPDDVLTGPSGLGELRREPLDPPVDAHVVDLDAALGQQLLDVSVGQAEPQVPAHRQGDDFGREPVSGEGRHWPWAEVRASVRSHERESAL